MKHIMEEKFQFVYWVFLLRPNDGWLLGAARHMIEQIKKVK